MEKNSDHSELYLDMIIEILLNLPVKTLSKFKCVCKSWLSLISSSSFQEQHYNHGCQRNPLLLISEKGYGILSKGINVIGFTIVTTLDNKKERYFSRTVPYTWSFFTTQSCRGLVCLASTNRKYLFLINPSTEEVIPLPKTQGIFNCCIGLGFTTLTNTFKVVRFYGGPTEEHTRCEVFTLGTNYWRQVMNPPPFSKMDASPFVNGSLHLLPVLNSYPQDEYISAFNIETEEFKKIRLPENYNLVVGGEDFDNIHLSDLEGTLCLTLFFTSRLEFWLLKDYHNKKWVKGYTIYISSLVGHFSFDYKTYPLAIMEDGSIMLNISGMTGTKLLRYDPETKVATVTLDVDSHSFATYFVESFFPLKKGNSYMVEEPPIDCLQ